MNSEMITQIDFGRENVLLACSTGGHLEELRRVTKITGLSRSQRSWITFDTDQSRDILADEDVSYVDYIAPRNLGKALVALPRILRAIHHTKARHVVSTGAAIAVPAAIASFVLRRKFIYIESITRFDGPSLSGRLVSLIPGTTCISQTRPWAGRKWKKGPSILSDYSLRTVTGSGSVSRVFITLGTIKPYRFDRALNALETVIPNDVSVRLQFGATSGDFPGNWVAEEMINDTQFKRNLDWADLVITHAGVGSTLNVLDSGKVPLLLVRESKWDEHVDDHQGELARSMGEVGLANVLDLSDLNWNKMKETASLLVEQ